MKKLFLLSIPLVLIACIDLCRADGVTSVYEPVQMSRESLKSSIAITDVRQVLNAGKIYIKDDFIIVNEKYEGFHIYDNSNPSSPLKVRFLEVPGATDIAIRDDVFYINQATDLVTLKFNSTNYSVTETGREIKVFTPLNLSPDGGYFIADDDKVIVKFKEIEE
ncbi:hypothetical protein [Wenyingzhuangia sp. IMCC45467]